MVSALSLVAIASLTAALDLESLFGSQYPVKYCNTFNAPYTCENKTEYSNECCFEKDGFMLLAQFWDYDLSLGKLVSNSTNSTATNSTTNSTSSVNSTEFAGTDSYEWGIGYFGEWLKSQWSSPTIDPSSHMPIDKSFTIHGLWSDKCDGTWEQYCQPDLEVPEDADLEELLVNDFDKEALFKLMETYWVNTADSNVAGDSNQKLWIHEYNKHATCMNTVNPSCFTDSYKEHEAAVLFWQKVTQIWDSLNTYEFLSASGIVPTTAKQYKLSDIQDALSKFHGDKEVHIGCTKAGIMNEIWYYYLLKGSVFTGTYKYEDALGSSTCPEYVWYIPK